jgi:ABC-2 type transport system permease protein
MNNAFQNSSSSIVSSKFTGDLEDLAIVPLDRADIIWAMSFACVIRGSIVSLMTFIAGEAFYFFRYQEFLGISHPLWLLYFLVLGGLVFGQLGLMAAFWAKTFDQLSAISAFLLLPLTYLGGVFLSIQHLHPIWQTVAQMNPLFYFINGLRYGMLGVSDVDISISASLTLVAFVVLHIMARRVLSKVSFSRW